jgi:hypothetical protein
VPEVPADDHDSSAGTASASLIDQLVREGARKMLAAALQAEVDAYIAAFADERDEHGRRLVVRNGSHCKEALAHGLHTEWIEERGADGKSDGLRDDVEP